ncbi:MAG: hypothetical protein KC550_06800, partial [Nanoarchaeota archaeon]|nr:hypothetical protein [Nanoarchaeota archaeon]
FLNSIIYIFNWISYYFLNFFVSTELINGDLILEGKNRFIIVKECIAPNAYILIGIIFMTLPVSFKTLRKILFKSILIFTFFNLVRILFLMWVHVIFGAYYFEKYHLVFYEGLSGIVTALIIIYYLRKEKIKKVYPVLSDVKYLLNSIRNGESKDKNVKESEKKVQIREEKKIFKGKKESEKIKEEKKKEKSK